MNWRDRLIQFMYGRYGMDNMGYGLLGLAVVIAVLNLFLRMSLLHILQTVILLFAIYRMFSKKVAQRRKENEVFNRFVKDIKLKLRRVKELRTHVYRTCPHCGKTLRFPRKKGQHTATCPVCKGDFNVKIRF